MCEVSVGLIRGGYGYWWATMGKLSTEGAPQDRGVAETIRFV
jgi:hypothetical protein